MCVVHRGDGAAEGSVDRVSVVAYFSGWYVGGAGSCETLRVGLPCETYWFVGVYGRRGVVSLAACRGGG